MGPIYVKVGGGHGARTRDLLLLGTGALTIGPPPPKSLVAPQLLYACSVLYVPDWVVKEVSNMLFSFLWSGKPDKIRRTTIVGDIESGGLKMIDFESMVKSLKVTWINRLLETDTGCWSYYTIALFKSNETTTKIVCTM